MAYRITVEAQDAAYDPKTPRLLIERDGKRLFKTHAAKTLIAILTSMEVETGDELNSFLTRKTQGRSLTVDAVTFDSEAAYEWFRGYVQQNLGHFNDWMLKKATPSRLSLKELHDLYIEE